MGRKVTYQAGRSGGLFYAVTYSKTKLYGQMKGRDQMFCVALVNATAGASEAQH